VASVERCDHVLSRASAVSPALDTHVEQSSRIPAINLKMCSSQCAFMDILTVTLSNK
jgi:hypothetical protein